MVESKPVWRLILGFVTLIAVAGCTNTFRGVERDMDNLLANRGGAASPSSASANDGAGEEWVDPR